MTPWLACINTISFNLYSLPYALYLSALRSIGTIPFNKQMQSGNPVYLEWNVHDECGCVGSVESSDALSLEHGPGAACARGVRTAAHLHPLFDN